METIDECKACKFLAEQIRTNIYVRLRQEHTEWPKQQAMDRALIEYYKGVRE